MDRTESSHDHHEAWARALGESLMFWHGALLAHRGGRHVEFSGPEGFTVACEKLNEAGHPYIRVRRMGAALDSLQNYTSYGRITPTAGWRRFIGGPGDDESLPASAAVSDRQLEVLNGLLIDIAGAEMPPHLQKPTSEDMETLLS